MQHKNHNFYLVTCCSKALAALALQINLHISNSTHTHTHTITVAIYNERGDLTQQSVNDRQWTLLI